MAPSSNIVFFDDKDWHSLLPLTFTRPACLLRIGILTIAEKWQLKLQIPKVGYITKEYLSAKYNFNLGPDNILIKSSLLPNENLIRAVVELDIGQSLGTSDQVIALRIDNKQLSENITVPQAKHKVIDPDDIQTIKYPEQIFKLNAQELHSDFNMLTKGRQSQAIESSNRYKNEDQIFIEEGASIEHSMLNATDGPIYIGKNAKILDGCMLRNGVALCEGSVMKMGAKVYGATTIGPQSKIGGEVKNTVILGNSNKSHDGYLGNAVIGEWCNLGADTNASNLKNNYSNATLWDYRQGKFRDTGDHLCGLIMGDHSKCGISTMFNTATVVGVSCNIFGAGFQERFIPSFSWGGPKGYEIFRLDKAIQIAETVLGKREEQFTQEDKSIFHSLFNSDKNNCSL